VKGLCRIAILLIGTRMASAEPIARHWIQAVPQDPGEKALGEALSKAGFQGPAGATQALASVASSYPGTPVAGLAHLSAGLALLDAGHAAEAAVQLRQPDIAKTCLADRALLALGAALEADGDLAGAALTYLRAADGVPGSPTACAALLHAGEVLEKGVQHDRAAAAFDRVVQGCPSQAPRALLREAETLEAGRELKGAAKVYDRLDRDYPASTEALRSETHRLALAPLLSPDPPDVRRDRDLKKGLALFDASRFPEAAAALRAALREGVQGSDVDLAHVRLGRALLAVGRPREAHAELALVKPSSDHGAEAAYYLGRLRFQLTRSSDSLEAVTKDFPGSPFAEEALLTLANHYQKDALEAGALPYYERMVAGFPDGHYILRATWRVAWALYRQGRFEDAAQLLERTAQKHPSSWTTPGFLYWAGRSRLALSQVDRARQLFDDTVQRYKYTYHGLKALDALEHLPRSTARAASLTALNGEPLRPDLPEPTLSRVRSLLLIEQLEMALDELSGAPPGPARDATLGWIDWRLGRLRPAITEMRQAYPEWLGEGGDLLPDDVWRILFPMQFRDAVVARAGAEGVDAALVAAVICQESTFDPGAVSHAGARGLMQLIPRTGMLVARSLGHTWRSQSLLDPGTNIEFGVHYLRQMLDRFGGRTEMALAAYNAGPERVESWNALRPDQPAEEFIESIPFTETRTYVLAILGSQEQYRRIYAFPPAPIARSATAQAQTPVP
jgi:soluble lytic murein transglycosylase